MLELLVTEVVFELVTEVALELTAAALELAATDVGVLSVEPLLPPPPQAANSELKVKRLIVL